MKRIYTLVTLVALIILGTSCNDEWKDEQYEQYVSFRSPLDVRMPMVAIRKENRTMNCR